MCLQTDTSTTSQGHGALCHFPQQPPNKDGSNYKPLDSFNLRVAKKEIYYIPGAAETCALLWLLSVSATPQFTSPCSMINLAPH